MVFLQVGFSILIWHRLQADRTSPELVLYKKRYKYDHFPLKYCRISSRFSAKKIPSCRSSEDSPFSIIRARKSFQVIVVTVQVIEDTGGIKLF